MASKRGSRDLRLGGGEKMVRVRDTWVVLGRIVGACLEVRVGGGCASAIALCGFVRVWCVVGTWVEV